MWPAALSNGSQKNVDHAGKITGMLLEQSPGIPRNLLINKDALLEQIIEADQVLQLAQQARQAQQAQQAQQVQQPTQPPQPP